MLLAGPLAPLALWSQKPPPDVADRVADRIAATGAREEQLVLVKLRMLVGGPLALQVVDALRRRGMNDVLKHSESGREILEDGVALGRQRERVNVMRVLLRAKYGDFDGLDELARRLSERDVEGNIALIVNGASVAKLCS